MPYSGPLRGGVRDVEPSRCKVGSCRTTEPAVTWKKPALLRPGPGGSLAAGPGPPAPSLPSSPGSLPSVHLALFQALIVKPLLFSLQNRHPIQQVFPMLPAKPA